VPGAVIVPASENVVRARVMIRGTYAIVCEFCGTPPEASTAPKPALKPPSAISVTDAEE